jgi:transcriptional regulator with XRE-family HTH domain
LFGRSPRALADRALRQARALTQEAAAEVIGIHPKHLQRLEAGAVNVTLATLVAITLSYGVPLLALWDESPVAADGAERG